MFKFKTKNWKLYSPASKFVLISFWRAEKQQFTACRHIKFFNLKFVFPLREDAYFILKDEIFKHKILEFDSRIALFDTEIMYVLAVIQANEFNVWMNFISVTYK